MTIVPRPGAGGAAPEAAAHAASESAVKAIAASVVSWSSGCGKLSMGRKPAAVMRAV